MNSPEHAEARQDQAPVTNLLGQRKEAELQVDAQHVKTLISAQASLVIEPSHP